MDLSFLNRELDNLPKSKSIKGVNYSYTDDNQLEKNWWIDTHESCNSPYKQTLVEAIVKGLDEYELQLKQH